MRGSPEREARNALLRLRRAVEKASRELEDAAAGLRHAEAGDFPAGEFETAGSHLDAVAAFVDEQSERLQEMVLQAGGLEPGRIRRSGGVR